MNNLDVSKLNWEKGQTLMPAIVQDAISGQVLMLGYMNQQALEKTLETDKVTFYSRTRQCLWVKGETSGHYLKLVDIFQDCDHDSLLVMATPVGPTCHTGNTACFANDDYLFSPLLQLQQILAARSKQVDVASYTQTLMKQGIARISQKIGEEATEIVIASLTESDQRLCSEIADFMYHLLVLLAVRKVSVVQVFDVLKQRRHKSCADRTK